ncbi:MAG: cation:proton antiporter [Saprospiraceae bacterium]|nr:cation:proton antiporter [Saprospiraceae bacterium]
MDFSNPLVIIILASVILVISYLFGLVARRTNVPSVLLLILLGIGISEYLKTYGISSYGIMPILRILGIIGLIMIVLEAAMDLKISKEKYSLIGKSFISAFVILMLTATSIAGIIVFLFDASFLAAMLYGAPLAIISSAIIIPSIENMVQHKKEFIIYESAFSDIFGIMAFYFSLSLLQSANNGLSVMLSFLFYLLLSVVVAIVSSYIIVFFFKDMKSPSRLFLLVAILFILYSGSELLNLYPLIIVLGFGLALANHEKFFTILRNTYNPETEDSIIKIKKEFQLITSETAFVLRTFFFVVFGMTINLSSLLSFNVFMISIAILSAIYLSRFVILKLLLKDGVMPELTLAPRGLLTILLLYSIPASLEVTEFDQGIFLYVILITSLVMTYGLILDGRKSKSETIIK